MAFVNVRNLVVPLTNKMHLFTIVFAMVLFAAFRLSGGWIGVSSSSEPGVRAPVQAAEERRAAPAADEPLQPLESLDPREQVRQMEAGRGDLVRELTKPEREAPKAPEKSDLDDIERQLGLR